MFTFLYSYLQYESNEIDNYLVKDARNFVIEDRPQEFLKFVAKMSIQNEFPGKVLLLTLLELILVIFVLIFLLRALCD